MPPDYALFRNQLLPMTLISQKKGVVMSQTKLSTEEARQAEGNTGLLAVLTISTLAATLLLGAGYVLFAAV